MQGWRVSKYDPSNRDKNGHYICEDWTSVHDIGKSIGDHLISVEEYINTEGAYIETAMAFHADAGAPLLFACDVEPAGEPPNVPGSIVSIPPAEGQFVSHGDLSTVIRSCLREIIWCRLESRDSACMIHFGYDYYMYLTGTELKAHAREVAQSAGLFLEPFTSPYLRKDRQA